MTEDDREAISRVLANIQDESVREKQYSDCEAVQYWLERLDDDAREIVREYFGEAVAQATHPYWSEAMQALGWFGWPNPERNAKYLADALHLYREGTYKCDDFLIALMNLKYPPVVELFRKRYANCDHRDCRCNVLIAHLAYLDPSASVTYGADLLSRSQEGVDSRAGVFFDVYGHLNPVLLKQLIDATFAMNPERGRLSAKTFADWLTWSGTWGTTQAREPLRSWMLKRAGTDEQGGD